MLLEQYQPATLLLIVLAAMCALCWTVVAATWPASSRDPRRRFVLVPVLLAVAAFAPLAFGLLSTTRNAYTGTAGTQASWTLISLYLFGAATVALVSGWQLPASRLNRIIFVTLCLYWLIEGLANYSAGLSISRLSFLLVPVIFFVSLRLRPIYRGAISVVMYVSIAVCASSLLLALLDPTVAFYEPSRFPAALLFAERLAGIVEHPNALGLFASVGFVLAWQSGGRTRWVGIPICGLALIASDSQGSWFACLAAIAILVAGQKSLGSPKVSALRLEAGGRISRRVVVGGILTLLAAWFIVTYLLPGSSVNGFTGRTSVWSFVLQHWGESPVLGHGSQVWAKLIAAGQLPVWAGQAHNQALQTLFTMGIVGVVTLGVLLFAWTFKSMQAATRGYWLPFALEVLIIIYGMFESPLSLGGVGGELWLLSILVFLDPISDTVDHPYGDRSAYEPAMLSVTPKWGPEQA